MIRFIIHGYMLVLIADAILSYLPQFEREPWRIKIKRVADFALRPVREFLPHDLPFDLSPLIVILLLNLLIALW